MNQDKVDEATTYAMENDSEAVLIFRNGCLVAGNAEDSKDTYQSWSIAKSVTSLAFGRAWALGLISPDDPVGAFFGKADAEHGAVTMRHLLTMTAGNEVQHLRDLNIVADVDRVHDALAVDLVDEPGKTWKYWQSGVALLAEAIGIAADMDFQQFVQEKLFTPIGIAPETWQWGRDYEGRTQGFYDLHLTAEAYGRLGELMRRGGMWKGEQLLSKEYVENALRPVDVYPCYGFLIWRSAVKACNDKDKLGLPEDMFQYAGRMGQLVTVFPTQGLVTVRTGSGFGSNSSDGSVSNDFAIERRFHDLVLDAIEDEPVESPHLPADPTFEYAVYAPWEFTAEARGVARPWFPAGLGPAGPWRSRAVIIGPAEVTPNGLNVYLELKCPPVGHGPVASCKGTASLDHGTEQHFEIARGEKADVWFPLDQPVTDERRFTARARTHDHTDEGTVSTKEVAVTRS
ncbi:serine hydrolase domain-containing protein [Amycolatopsis suaedae]|nr:serine hydrolase [Amycolatopsis suaedae]